MIRKDKKVNGEEDETEPTALDKPQITVESCNKSVPDIAKIVPSKVQLSSYSLNNISEPKN